MKKASRFRLFKILSLVSIASLFLFGEIGSPADPKKDELPPWYEVHLPPGAEMIQKISGSVSFKIRDEVRQVERNYRAMFDTTKNISSIARTAGSTRIIIFKDNGKRPWCTIQITGVIAGRTTFLVISKDEAAAIDDFR